jgi:hypothetical protein
MGNDSKKITPTIRLDAIAWISLALGLIMLTAIIGKIAQASRWQIQKQ